MRTWGGEWGEEEGEGVEKGDEMVGNRGEGMRGGEGIAIDVAAGVTV